MKNWKTTVGGLVASIGAAMQISPDRTVQIIGYVVISVGVAFFGASAKDNNVTGGTKQQ